MFEQLEGSFGGRRDDYQAASIVRAVISVNRKKGSKEPSIEDCMLKFGDATKKKPMHWTEMKRIAMELTQESKKEHAYQEQRLARRRK